MGDVSSQAWPVTATGRVEACLLPSWCQKFDPGLRAPTSVMAGDSAGPPRGPTLQPEAEFAPSGSGKAESPPPFEESGETKPAPLVSDETEPAPLGLGKTESSPEGSGEYRNHALNRPGEFMLMATGFLPLGIPNIDTRHSLAWPNAQGSAWAVTRS
jgi:hypothetical protein